MIELNTSPLRQRVIDVDDRRTWTKGIQTCVDEWATQYRGTTKYTADLPVPLEDESAFQALFRGHLLRVYHCTKLLPHEVAMIKTDGLRPLSASLVLDRINAAHAAGVFSQDEAEELKRGMSSRWASINIAIPRCVFFCRRACSGITAMVAPHCWEHGAARQSIEARGLKTYRSACGR